MRDEMHSVLQQALKEQVALDKQGSRTSFDLPSSAVSAAATVAFARMDERLLEWLASSAVTGEERLSGCCVTVALTWPARVVVAWVGDSRAVLCGRNGVAVDLTVDHRAGGGLASRSETARVQRCGGWISQGRVLGLLAVTRALGDVEFKGGLAKTLADGVRDGFWKQERAAQARSLCVSATVFSKVAPESAHARPQACECPSV